MLGTTPLMYAAEYNPNPEVITALLAAGADAKAKDNKLSALRWVLGNEWDMLDT